MGTYKYQAEIDALIQQGLKMPEVVKPNDLIGFRSLTCKKYEKHIQRYR